MKPVLFLVLLFVSGSLLAQKVNNAFVNIEQKVDKTVPAGKNKLVFIVKSPSDVEEWGEIQYSVNDEAFSATPDANKQFTLTVSKGKKKFAIWLASSFKEIHTDSVPLKGGCKTIVHLRFQRRKDEQRAEKPVVYIYSKKPTAFSMDLGVTGTLSYTYPSYEKGWSGTTNNDGSVSISGKNYPYLFWESKSSIPQEMSDYAQGYLIAGSESTTFLEEKLTQMGLNQREMTDFITYWAPRMEQSEKGFVQFMFNDACNPLATLTVTPKPEQIFRVFMLWTPLQADNAISAPQPQVLPVISRTGFHVVEWGGSELIFQPKPLANY